MRLLSIISPEGRRLFCYWLGALLLSLFWGRLYGTHAGLSLDSRIPQYQFELRGPREPPAQVILVAIDPPGYEEIGREKMQPLAMTEMADLLESIAKGNPAAVIIDFSLGDGTGESQERITRILRTSPTTLPDGNIRPEDADVFSRRMSFNYEHSEIYNSAQMHLPMVIGALHETLSFMSPLRDDDNSSSLYERVPLLRPLREFTDIRIIPPEHDAMINFYGPPGVIHTVSFARLLWAPTPLLEYYLGGKVVLLGVMGVQCGRSDMDLHEISGSTKKMYGVEVHANIVGNLIDGSWLRRMNTADAAMMAVVVSFFVILLGLVPPIEISALLIVVALAGLTWCHYLAFSLYRFYIPGLIIVWAAGASVIMGRFAVTSLRSSLKKRILSAIEPKPDGGSR